jgi:methionyl-tRNA formyltransferase
MVTKLDQGKILFSATSMPLPGVDRISDIAAISTSVQEAIMIEKLPRFRSTRNC